MFFLKKTITISNTKEKCVVPKKQNQELPNSVLLISNILVSVRV